MNAAKPWEIAQYANDLRYPPTADSIPRRLAAIEAVLVKLEI